MSFSNKQTAWNIVKWRETNCLMQQMFGLQEVLWSQQTFWLQYEKPNKYILTQTNSIICKDTQRQSKRDGQREKANQAT